MRPDDHYLVLHALAAESIGMLSILSDACTQSGCQVLDARGARLGNSFSFGALLRGSWPAIARLETLVAKLQKKHSIKVEMERTQRMQLTDDHQLPYSVQLVARERAGIFSGVTQFLSAAGVHIVDIQTDTYTAPKTLTPMLSLNMTVSIPEAISLSTFRDEFLEYCEDRQLDVVLEPCKPL